MNRLECTVKRLASSKKKALVTYITSGYPSAAMTVRLVSALETAGADIIELGVPFSDPIADGPTIQYASQQALDKGMSFPAVLRIVRDVRKTSDIPLVLMGYLNPLYHYGFERAAREAKENGADGFIIPDVVPEEAGDIERACRKYDLSLIYLVAPTTPPERMARIDSAGGPFAYIVSLTGVTGGRKKLSKGIDEFLAVTSRRIRKNPRYVGFGISGPGQARKIKRHADGVIVGSAIIDTIRSSKTEKEQLSAVQRFTASLRKALDR